MSTQNPTGPELVYIQIADHIAARIIHEDFKPGQRLPSAPQLADVYGVMDLTIRRAIRELRERGLVLSIHGSGTYVTQSTMSADRRFWTCADLRET